MIAPAVKWVLPESQQYYIDEIGETMNHNSDVVGIKIKLKSLTLINIYYDKGRTYICYKYWLGDKWVYTLLIES